MALYDEDVRVFDTWYKWEHTGKAAWRGAIGEWFGMIRAQQVEVSFDDIQIEAGETVASLNAIVKYADIGADGKEVKSLSNRLSWTLRESGDGWKIIHEHTSAPVDPATIKANLSR